MRKIMMLFVALFVAVVSNCSAREYSLNPDRFPSLGVNLTIDSATGESKYPSSPGLGSQDLKGVGSLLMIDTRLPLSNSFTLNIGLGGASSEMKADETPTLNSQKQTSSEGIFNIGFRYYFNK